MSSAPVILPDLCPVEVVETKLETETETKSKVETSVVTKVETEVETEVNTKIDQVIDQIEIEESIEKLDNIDENDLQKACAKENTATKMVQVRNIQISYFLGS